MTRLVKALAAALLLLFLIVGVPFILWRIAGWPLPESMPDVGNVIEMIGQANIPADAVIKTIAVVVWLAWLQLMWSVLWETIVNIPRLASGRTWRPPPLVLSPVGDGVARLVSVILAVGVITASTPGVATALSTPSGLGQEDRASTTLDLNAAATTTAVELDVAGDAPQWRVGADDDLWSIAEQSLGDGSLVDQILQLNPGVSARSLTPGTILELPAGALGNGPDRPTEIAATGSDVDSVPGMETDSIVSELDESDDVAIPDDVVWLDSAAPDATESPVAEEPSTSVAEYVVRENDGMWNVADALLGDGSRHVEMTEMVKGQEVAPGVVFDDDTFVIQPGWVFRLDATSTATDPMAEPSSADDDTYVVEAGDTLSEIAAEHLGDASDWSELWEANAHEDMGGGRTFDDPDLILPGWELDLAGETTDVADASAESDANADSIDDVEPDDAEVELPAVAEDNDEPAVDGAPDVEADLEPEASVDVETALEADATDLDIAVPPPTTVPDVAATGGAGSSELGADQTAPAAPSPVRMEHAALVAAGLLALIGVRRRRALRAARPHSRVPAPAPERAAVERRLRTVDAGERAARVDIACRAIAATIAETGTQIGTVRVAKDGELLIRLTAPADLSDPFEGSDADWVLPASTPIEMLSDSARTVGQPCLAMVTIGIDDEERDVLVDLEAAGVTVIGARPDQADDVVRAIGAGLATSINAEVIHLVTAALSVTCLFGHPNAHRAAGPSEALHTATSLIGPTVAQGTVSFDLRTRRTGGEMWEPAVLLLSHDDDAGSTIDTLDLPLPGRGLAIVSPDTSPTLPDDAIGARIEARSDGWTFDAFGQRIEITPIGVTADDLDSIADVVREAGKPIESDDFDEITIVPAGLSNDRSADDEPFAPIPHDIIVRLLGPVRIVDAQGELAAFERSKTVELIAWLATHRDRATRTAARTALWELDVRDATFANVVSEARRGLGRLVDPDDGEEWLARTLNESLPLHDRVVTDADLVSQRVEHARLSPPSVAIDVLRPAVEMISGLPFSATSYLWPDADGITSNLVLLATTAASELAGHALSMGDTDLVFWATGQGLKVLPGHEELIGLRMRAHARAGDLAGVRGEWESYERVVTADAWSDGEPAPKLLSLRRELLTAST